MRRWTTVVFASGLALGAAACGSSGRSRASASATSSASTATNAVPVVGLGTVSDAGTADETGQGMSVTMTMEADDSSFKPTFVKVEPGATVTLEVTGEGLNEHTFTTQGLSPGIDRTIDPGAKQTVTFVVPGTGAVRFYCRFHLSMGMQGAFYTHDGQTVIGSPVASASASTTTAAEPRTTTTRSSG